ncbi:aromatic compound dioxygenase [Daldinia decipiens]|uniref:aromatic compound dioxygenase n=1 Tax=Daldinia decipiens TaxID=326647 RepID=UPI0020C38ACF|nr:aromatic compound dioxygenase [Daldinia decipiens]KAI1661948.1 aromatic compound dioxygenase [Daldinia decipiens]
MVLTKKENETDGAAAKAKYDLELTDNVIAATGSKAHPRLKEIMPSLIRHLHDFARDIDLTIAELAAGIELINEAGRMSTDKRKETSILSDILGLEPLVDNITSKLPPDSSESGVVTPSTATGPYYRKDAPLLPNGSSIIKAAPDSFWYLQVEKLLTHLSGRVLSASTGKPAPGAIVDLWQAAPNGKYELQDPEQPDMNLRGRFQTDELGRYALYCVRPGSYKVTPDGPASRLLELLDRHPYRPAHIHFMITAPGFRTLTTQVFDRDDKYVKEDPVFAARDELLASFEPCEGDGKAHWTVKYDFVLSEA